VKGGRGGRGKEVANTASSIPRKRTFEELIGEGGKSTDISTLFLGNTRSVEGSGIQDQLRIPKNQEGEWGG